ncbi:hypothetical protein JJB07_22875 [Tumebacillus sp. ITR2]|uniref:DUF5704 domain-containing protein n=1 Tax=Tumebacillus amylolyticus TaxID=2801339 RepID=A0ABS1JGM3_9BACL|nr:DUF5704 domain-containing protein [Tumebacillus amylolyticus]MBL0389439.1 hypothetical protein [Tumebacillus amylolyticus]
MTFFSVNIAAVDRAFQKIGHGGAVYKQKVYINSIFHIYHPKTGVIDPTPYYTPQDIMAARNWSAIGSMGQYYDIFTVVPPPPAYPVEAICSLPDGTTLPCNTKSKLNDSGLYTNNIGDFKKGDPVSWTFPFELTSNGTNYQLQQSYITPHDDLQQQTISVPASQTMTRNITADDGGNYIVGVYKPKSSVTVTATINGPTEVDDTVTDVDATFTFEAKSTNLDLDHYQITDTQNCDFVRTTDKSGKLTGKDDGKAGLPIKIHMGTGPNIKCSITVKAFDVGAGSDQTTAQHSVVKASQPAAPQASGGTDLNPNSSGKIGADPYPSEKFNVLQGIPTHESLYTQAGGKRYLYDYHYQQKTGQKSYPVTVKKTYVLTWQVEKDTGEVDSAGNPVTTWESQTETQVVTKPYNIKRNYSYWLLDKLQVFAIDHAGMGNYALPNGQVSMYPLNYNAPSVTAQHSDGVDNVHVFDPDYPKEIDLGSQSLTGGQNEKPTVPVEDWLSDADAKVPKIQVKNDAFTFDGSTLMSDAKTEENGPNPSGIPAPRQYDDDDHILYLSGQVIATTKQNYANAPSNGTIYYRLTGSTVNSTSSAQSAPISGINTVTVHTPTVCYCDVADDQDHNQMTVPDTTRRSLILTRTFQVSVPTNGQHQSFKNYGNRDYAEYIQARQVWFPFDVYMDKQWKKAGQWLTIPAGAKSYEFELPVWVNEGDYDVKFRAIAENSPIPPTNTNRDNSFEEDHANLSNPNHIATKVIPVKVIGRLFDFKITDVADYNWELVFRPAKGSRDILPNRSYWIGDQDFNGDKRNPTVAPPFELPLGPNSSPLAGYGYNAVKTGYHFKFDLKTVGNMYGLTDGVRITPSFSFVTKDGKTRYDNVDLYYSTNSHPFIKIGSPEDTQQRQLVLNTPLRNVTNQEFTDTATFLYDRVFNDLGRSKAGDRTLYISNYSYKAEKPTAIGTAYSWQLLASGVRTFIGTHNPDAGDAALANASVQKWYGEYSLPAAVKVVKAGTDLANQNSLDDHSPIWLKNGYIIVNFNIETIQNGNTSAPHLQYIHGPLDNQWHMEGMRSSFTDADDNTFQIADGDVLYYHADQSSYDDLGTYVPH